MYLTAFYFPKIYHSTFLTSFLCSIPTNLMATNIMPSGETQLLGSLVVSPYVVANGINDLTLGFPRRSGGLFALLLSASSLARFPAVPSAPSEHHIRDHRRSAPPKTAADLRPSAFLRGCQQDVADSVAPAWSFTGRASPSFKNSSVTPPSFSQNEKKKNHRERLENNLLQVPLGFFIIPYDSPNLHNHILKLVAEILCRRCRPCSTEGSSWKRSRLCFFCLSAGVNQKGSHQN